MRAREGRTDHFLVLSQEPNRENNESVEVNVVNEKDKKTNLISEEVDHSRCPNIEHLFPFRDFMDMSQLLSSCVQSRQNRDRQQIPKKPRKKFA